MFPIAHYIKGIAKNLFNPHISIFAIVSANAQVDKTACIYRGVKESQHWCLYLCSSSYRNREC